MAAGSIHAQWTFIMLQWKPLPSLRYAIRMFNSTSHSHTMPFSQVICNPNPLYRGHDRWASRYTTVHHLFFKASHWPSNTFLPMFTGLSTSWLQIFWYTWPGKHRNGFHLLQIYFLHFSMHLVGLLVGNFMCRLALIYSAELESPCSKNFCTETNSKHAYCPEILVVSFASQPSSTHGRTLSDVKLPQILRLV